MSDDFVYVGTPLEAVAVKPPQQGRAGQRRDSNRQVGIDGRRTDDASSNANPASTSLPVAEQVALDAQGRRRFHGAFTGGYSAGYFNSVGSAEGWKPSSFVSSRRQRGGEEASTAAAAPAAAPPLPQQRTARDFMDEDELAEAEAKEAAALRTARGYSKSGREQEQEGEEGSRPDARQGAQSVDGLADAG